MRQPWLLLLSVVLWATLGNQAQACLSCGCGGSGVSSDLGGGGGTASMFSMGHHWLVQAGTDVRAITGSFNERGNWNPAPVGGSLTAVQSSLGFNYFPDLDSSVTLQVPVVANRLAGATWGPLGSISPTDTAASSGLNVGDLALQGTRKLYEAGNFALSAWGGLTLPTGNVTGAPAGFSGSGIWSGQAGVVGLTQLGDWEFVGNLGYEQPFGTPALTTTDFYVGQAVLYQVAVNYSINPSLRAGLGFNGYNGLGRFGANSVPIPMAKFALVPSVQYAWSQDQGTRIAVGVDPSVGGSNALTGLSATVVFYQYLR
jgi:hypothetical protein